MAFTLTPTSVASHLLRHSFLRIGHTVLGVDQTVLRVDQTVLRLG